MLTARTRGLILGALTADLAVLVYLDALRNPFVYDDIVGVVRNVTLVDGGLLALMRENIFRPVVSLSLAFDHGLWGLRAPGYHITSVLLHALNTALLFALARRAVADWRARVSAPGLDGDVAATVAAGLFAVHPLLSEAVGYVTGRGDVLAATFVLAALLALRAGVTSVRARVLGLALMVAGALTKEVAVVLPVVALAGDRLLLDGDAAARRRRLLAWHAPIFAVAGAAGLARTAGFFWVERSTTSGAAWPAHVQTQLEVVWRYLALLVAPVGQSLVHDVPPPATPVDPRALGAALALFAAGALAWRARHRQPLVVFGGVWFLTFLAPAAAVALYEPMVERRVYLASAGVFLAVAAVAAAAWARAGRRARLAGVTVFALVVVVLGALTVARNLAWRDAETLWRDATRKAPGAWRAHAGLANALGEQGRCHEALPEYETALRLSPQPEVLTNYGLCLAAERRVPEAKRAFERALELDPGYAMAHHNLGLLALHAGDIEGAHAHFMRAVSMNPHDAWWRQNLMRIYELEIRDPAKTLELCRAIVRVAGRETPGALACLERYERRAARTER
jgi:Tfp pilus assembly protein PilF